MRALSLYSGGVAGLDIAAGWAGIEVAAFCEADPFCRRILAVRFPGVPLYESDEEVTYDRLRRDGIWPIDIIFGGPPCQPASGAGKRLGTADSRWRWPEVLRIVREVRPRWVVFENPRGILSVNAGGPFRSILRELADLGYCVGHGLWGACDVGAPHLRERVFIVGHLADPVRDESE